MLDFMSKFVNKYDDNGHTNDNWNQNPLDDDVCYT